MALRRFAEALDADRDRIASATRNLAFAQAGVGVEPLSGVFEVGLDALLGSLRSGQRDDVTGWAESLVAEIPGTDVEALFGFLCAIVGYEARVLGATRRTALAFLASLQQSVAATIAEAEMAAERYAWRGRVRSSVAVATLLATLGVRDRGTRTHVEAAGIWSRRLATAIGLPEDTVAFVERCGLVHDVGKIAIAETILNKPEALDGRETVLMREHPARGADLLAEIPALRDCAPVVRAHHERVDGTGYPDGLSGSQIPLAARIVAVADAFDSMIGANVYRQSLPPRVALDILREGAGTQWDRRVVGAMLDLLGGEALQPARTERPAVGY